MARFLILLTLVFASALHARQVDVQNVGASESEVARLQSQVEPAFSHVKTQTGVDDQLDLQLVVVGGSRSFAELAARDGVGMHAESVLGYAQPGRRRIVLNLSGIRDRQLEPIGVLRHEIAHLVMGSALRVERPLWFEEGVAQYVESVALNELREAAGASPWLDFDNLADLDQALREEARAGAAYIEAREVIRLIVERFGESRFFKLMKRLESGDGPFEKAFEDVTGDSVATFENAWLEDRAGRAGERYAGFFGRNFWWLLLGLTALIIPLALVLARMRGKTQIDQWEETEKYFPSDPSWSYTDDEPAGYTPEDPDAWKQ
ncbi:MAG: hypothetical protein K8I27_03070 [Planctomycetes bacterium]|nr:hypothetical protein [Planctomycetota bacterium]